MKLYFGEHYYEGGSGFWESLLVTALGAFFGFGFALLLYYFQIKRDKRKSQDETNKVFTDRLIYFELLLEGVIEHSADFAYTVLAYVDVQRKDLMNTKILKAKINNDIQRLDKQDAQGILLAYRHFFSKNPNWIKDYRKVYKAIDSITELHGEMKRLYRYNGKDIYRRQIKIKEILEEMANRMANFHIEVAKKYGKQSAVNQLIETFLNQYQALIYQTASLSEFDKQFLQPLMNGLVQYRQEDFAKELLPLGKNARTGIGDLGRDISGYLNEMESYAKHIPKIVETLDLEKKKINTVIESK